MLAITGHINFQSGKTTSSPNQAPIAPTHEMANDDHSQSNRENASTSYQTNQPANTSNEQEQKLASAIDSSNRSLVHIKSFSLLDFLKSEIVVDVTKVTFIIREIFAGKDTISVAAQDIVEVKVYSTPFFSSLQLHAVMTDESNRVFKVSYLNKSEAQQALCIIQGLEIAMKQGIDLTQVQDENLLQQIETLGKSAS